MPKGCFVMKQLGAISHPSARCSESSLNLVVPRHHKQAHIRSVRVSLRVSISVTRFAASRMVWKRLGCCGRTCQDYPVGTAHFCCAWSDPHQRGAIMKSHRPALFQWQGVAGYHLCTHASFTSSHGHHEARTGHNWASICK